MAITYPVDVANTRWAILRLSTGEIIARNKTWPVADGSAIPGLDPDYVYLLHVNATPPNYDSRTHRLIATETVDAEANELRLTYAAEPRTADEVKIAAENREAEANNTLLRLQREAYETRLTVGAIIKFALRGQQFPQRVQSLMNDYEAKAVRVWNNRDRLDEIKAALDAGQNPDLDAGWEEDPE